MSKYRINKTGLGFEILQKWGNGEKFIALTRTEADAHNLIVAFEDKTKYNKLRFLEARHSELFRNDLDELLAFWNKRYSQFVRDK